MRSRRSLLAAALSGAVGLAVTARGSEHAVASGLVQPLGYRTVHTRSPAVALTFDDGPDPQNTPKLQKLLRRNHIRAVFCLWGEHARQ